MQHPPDGETWKDLFANYAAYNKALRTWFVTFGLGGPSLFLINDKLAATLTASGNMKVVVGSFLSGWALQVLIALLNKHCAWYAYNGKRVPEKATTRWYRLWACLERSYWLDIICDLGTMIFFGVAVWEMVSTFVA